MNTESGIPLTTLYADEAPSGYIEPPTNTQFHSGVEPEMTLPAAWWNYFVNLFTNTNIKTKEDITAILAELNNVLTTMGITPDPEASNQLATLFQNDVLPATFANENMNANPYTTSSLVPKHRGNIAINTTTRTIWIATNTTAAAASWSRLWSPENDGSGSGLDADTVDGSHYNATDILTKLKTVDGSGSGLDADTVDGLEPTGANNTYLAVTKNGITDLNDVNGNGIFFNSTTTAANRPASFASFVSGIQFYIDNNFTYKVQIIAGNNSDNWFVRAQSNGIWRGWQKLWNAGNDGAGSGLDADLLDGLDSTSFCRRENKTGGSANDIVPAAITICDSSVTNMPSAGVYCVIITTGDSSNTQQLAFDLYTEDSFFMRKKMNGTWKTWLRIWNSGNDGSGSGLDADLLDGQHGSYYAPKASPAFTGSPTAPTPAAAANSTQVATTAFVKNQSYAPLASPALTGSPTVNGKTILHSGSVLESDTATRTPNDYGSTLPTANASNHGRFFYSTETGLYYCARTGSSTYTWLRILIF